MHPQHENDLVQAGDIPSIPWREARLPLAKALGGTCLLRVTRALAEVAGVAGASVRHSGRHATVVYNPKWVTLDALARAAARTHRGGVRWDRMVLRVGGPGDELRRDASLSGPNHPAGA